MHVQANYPGYEVQAKDGNAAAAAAAARAAALAANQVPFDATSSYVVCSPPSRLSLLLFKKQAVSELLLIDVLLWLLTMQPGSDKNCEAGAHALACVIM